MQVDASGGVQGAAPCMSAEVQIFSFNQFDDISTSSDTVATARIHLDNIHSARLDEPAIAFDVPLVLACPNGCSHCGTKASMAFQVRRLEGLFYPFEPVWFEVAKTLY